MLNLSKTDVLRLAAGVEKNTNHPIGKAIVAAAQALNCAFTKVSFVSFDGCCPSIVSILFVLCSDLLT